MDYFLESEATVPYGIQNFLEINKKTKKYKLDNIFFTARWYRTSPYRTNCCFFLLPVRYPSKYLNVMYVPVPVPFQILCCHYEPKIDFEKYGTVRYD